MISLRSFKIIRSQDIATSLSPCISNHKAGMMSRKTRSLGLLFIFCLPACAAQSVQPSSTSVSPAQELFSRSRNELSQQDYEQAYSNYMKAVETDRSLLNLGYMTDLLYEWAASECEENDSVLLEAQKQVALAPQKVESRRKLLSLAVDADNGTMSAFGIATAPMNISSQAQMHAMARRAALTDARRWLARLQAWSQTGIETPFDIESVVISVETVREYWISETLSVIKVRMRLFS